MPHLISISDLTDDDLWSIITTGADLATGKGVGHPLAGDVVGVYFAKTSTRTRTAFSSGALRLGAQILAYGPEDLQLNTGETMADTGRVLSGMLDAMVARTAGPTEELRALAAHESMAVVNAMTAEEHPTQALADLTTMLLQFGTLNGLRVLYVGEGNNTAVALALAMSRLPGLELELRTPPGYGLPFPVNGITERHDMDDLPSDVDVIYTTRWQTTGTSKSDPDWRRTFAPFRVSARLWRDSPKAVLMHDLPAHRGEEVTADELDGPASIAFTQAHNKLFSAMAVLKWCRS